MKETHHYRPYGTQITLSSLLKNCLFVLYAFVCEYLCDKNNVNDNNDTNDKDGIMKKTKINSQIKIITQFIPPHKFVSL